MGKREQLRELSGRCQPAYHARDQLLNRQHICVVLPQSTKARRRVGRTSLGIDGEQAQPNRCRSGSCSREGPAAAW
jgi:hypothetical protein